MSITIFENQYIEKTGTKLPRAYLEKVVVKDTIGQHDAGYIELEVTLTSYIQKSFDILDDDFNDYVADIISTTNFCVAYLPKGNIEGSDAFFLTKYGFLDSNNYLDVVSKIKNGSLIAYDIVLLNDIISEISRSNQMRLQTTVYDNYYYGPMITSISKMPIPNLVPTTDDTIPKILYVFDKSSLTSPYEIITNDQGVEFVKISLTNALRVPNEVEQMRPTGTGDSEVVNLDTSVDNGFSFDLVSFTSILDSETELAPKPTIHLPMSEEELDPDRFPKETKNQQISDLSYETITAEGTYQATPQIVYRSSVDGTVFTSGQPIQALDNLYYTPSSITLSSIIESFKAIVGTTSNEQLQNSYDNVNYILETHGQSAKLLTKLNDYRKVYPDKTNLTPAGEFYQIFENLLYNTNVALKNSGITLIKSVNVNPTVVDARSGNLTGNMDAIVERERIGDFSSGVSGGQIKFKITDDDNNFINIDNSLYGTYTDPVEVKSSLDLSGGIEWDDFEDSLVSDFTLSDALRNELGGPDDVQERIDAAFSALKDVTVVTWTDTGERPTTATIGASGAAPDSDYRIFFKKLIEYITNFSFGVAAYNHPFDLRLSKPAMSTRTAFGSLLREDHGSSHVVDLSSNTAWMVNFVSEFFPDRSTNRSHASTALDITPAADGAAYPARYHIDTGSPGYSEFIKNLQTYYCYATLYDMWSLKKVTSFNHFLFGYWWFDYEKALKERSILSYAFPIQKIEQFFGKNLTNDSFKLYATKIDKFSINRSNTSVVQQLGRKEFDPASADEKDCIKEGHLTSYFTDEVTNRNHKTVSNEIALQRYTDGGSMSDLPPFRKRIEGSVTCTDKIFNEDQLGTLGVDVVDASAVEYTYNILRPAYFDSEELNNYRLMCFEHQEVSGHIGSSEDMPVFDYYDFYQALDGNYQNAVYQHSVFIKDETLFTIKAIVQNYRNCRDGSLATYLNIATEQCNYSAPDGPYNNFFIDAQLSVYAENPGGAPWYTAPVVYHYHLDLLTNVYNGNFDEIFVAAKKDTYKISPQSGTFLQLEAFVERFNNLYETYYSATGVIETRINNIFGDVGTYSIDSFEELRNALQPIEFTTHYNILSNIPEPLNLIVPEPNVTTYEWITDMPLFDTVSPIE